MGPLTWHTVNSALNKNYDELNRFTGRLTYSILRFFSAMPKGGGENGTMPPPPP